MKQQEISQDTPYPLIAFSFRTFHLCMSSGHYCMEFFGLRMPLLDKPTLLPQLDLLFPSRLVGIQNPPSSIKNKWQYCHRAPIVYLGSERDECILPNDLLPCT